MYVEKKRKISRIELSIIVRRRRRPSLPDAHHPRTPPRPFRIILKLPIIPTPARRRIHPAPDIVRREPELFPRAVLQLKPPILRFNHRSELLARATWVQHHISPPVPPQIRQQVDAAHIARRYHHRRISRIRRLHRHGKIHRPVMPPLAPRRVHIADACLHQPAVQQNRPMARAIHPPVDHPLDIPLKPPADNLLPPARPVTRLRDPLPAGRTVRTDMHQPAMSGHIARMSHGRLGQPPILSQPRQPIPRSNLVNPVKHHDHSLRVTSAASE